MTRDEIERVLDASQQAVEAALCAVYDRQTAEEKAARFTKVNNGVGFSKFDAEFCSSLVQQLKKGRSLTFRQLQVARPKMKRYWRQLGVIMTTDAPPEPMVEMSPSVNTPSTVEPVSNVTLDAEKEALSVYGSW